MAKPAHRDEAHPQTHKHTKVRPPVSMQPPMAPMIDVTFQLLIFFLLTCTFRKAEGMIPGSLPKVDGGVIDAKFNVYVRPTANHQAMYQLEGLPTAITSPDELYRHLSARRQAMGGSDHVNVLIYVSGDVQWRWAVEAHNQALRAGYKQISFRRDTGRM